jgi:hypothetical protein
MKKDGDAVERVPDFFWTANFSKRKVKTVKLKVAGCVTLILALASLPFVLTAEYRRVTSPDGRFYAVATYPIWQAYVPMSPGSSGDKSGYIAVYTRDGKSCGRVSVEMVWFIQDIQWGVSTAEVPLVADWDLVRRKVQRHGR